MKFACVEIVLSSWVLFTIVSTATAEKAQWLLRYHKESKTFELNEEVLPKLSLLKQPIKVVSAIGDARVGKSTTLNFVRHALENYEKGNSEYIEEVFQTGDTFSTVTHGIWISIFREQRNGGSIVLLDVEGVNLGNDAVTNYLSLFTALISSGIGLFCSENVNNHILHFLYMIPRLSKHVFKDIHAKNVKKFGHLHVVIRGGLEPPAGQSLENFIRDAIIEPAGDDVGIDNERREIGNNFHREAITVSEMPLILGGKLFRNTSRVKENIIYWKFIETLSSQFKKFPEKTTLRGVHVDGTDLTKLAQTLVETINKNSWMEFGDFYLTIENSICDKNYDDLIAPALKMETSREVEDRYDSAMDEFKYQCPLPNKVQRATKHLRNRMEELRVREREMEEEEERRKNASWYSWTWTSILLATGIAGFFLRGVFSDARLKKNITTLTPSKYEILGLREVAWVWNEDAEGLGLRGEARGVIAQEVEQLYPWAVVTGHAGYKRVHYAALDLMVALGRNKHISRIAKISNGILPFLSEYKSAVGDVRVQPLPRDGRDGSVVTKH